MPLRALPAGTCAAVLMALTTACGGAATGSAPAVVPSPGAAGPAATGATAAVVAVRHTWGGMCADGPCRSDLVVLADGAWTVVTETEADAARGTLAPDELAGLEDAVSRTRLGEPGAPVTGCAADADGTSVRYGWSEEGRPRSASSCEQAVPADDPLVRRLEALAADVMP